TALAQKAGELRSDEAGAADDDDLHVGVLQVGLRSGVALCDADVVPQATAEVLAGALECRPNCLEDLSKGPIRRVLKIPSAASPLGRPCFCSLAIACSIRTGGSSRALPRRFRSALRYSICSCIWSRTAPTLSARTTCSRRSGTDGS